MKQIIANIALALVTTISLAQVGIGTKNPAPSAVLDVTSTTKGFLPPRLTTAQRDAIASPAQGLTIYNTNNGCLEFFDASNWISVCNGTISSGSCIGQPAEILFLGNTYRPITVNGQCWLDRNLGSSQIASAINDSNSYGHLYQWGRGTDGHQLRSLDCATSDCFNAGSNPSALPANAAAVTGPTWAGKFIRISPNPRDWHQANPDNTLWQGVSGTNNPCPTGYKLPTLAEWSTVSGGNGSTTIGWANAGAAFNSPLKLPAAGSRAPIDGTISGSPGTNAYYWTSTVNGVNASVIELRLSDNVVNVFTRASGASVRCIKN